jgi:hypothetical protein
MNMQTIQPTGENAAAAPKPRYELPSDTYKDWQGYETRSFVPNARQSLVVDAVGAALQAGLYYSDEVREFCAKQLDISPEQAAVGIKHVEGGAFAMDCYYSRGYLRARKAFELEAEHHRLLKPFVGQELGTLVFNDLKRTTGVKVTSIFADGYTLELWGKRGRSEVKVTTNATGIAEALDRAAKRGARKAGFAESFPSALPTHVSASSAALQT